MKDESKEPKRDFVVIDVRDDDYAGGNIKGSINYPSQEFLMNVDGLVKQVKEVPLVIFHCSLSQVRYVSPSPSNVDTMLKDYLRGPKAARVRFEG